MCGFAFKETPVVKDVEAARWTWQIDMVMGNGSPRNEIGDDGGQGHAEVGTILVIAWSRDGRNGDFGMRSRVDLLTRKPTAPDCQRRGVFGCRSGCSGCSFGERCSEMLGGMTRGWLLGLRYLHLPCRLADLQVALASGPWVLLIGENLKAMCVIPVRVDATGQSPP